MHHIHRAEIGASRACGIPQGKRIFTEPWMWLMGNIVMTDFDPPQRRKRKIGRLWYCVRDTDI